MKDGDTKYGANGCRITVWAGVSAGQALIANVVVQGHKKATTSSPTQQKEPATTGVEVVGGSACLAAGRHDSCYDVTVNARIVLGAL
jgi:hypothetical protein